jgi:hypothetical protein
MKDNIAGKRGLAQWVMAICKTIVMIVEKAILT